MTTAAPHRAASRAPGSLSPLAKAVLFANAEEAWLWTMAALVARREGARIVSGAGTTLRPCEPDDLLVSVERLARVGRLRAAHIRTLFAFGRRLAPPDPRRRDEVRAAALWDEALDRLTTPWRAKGIVA